MDTTIKKILEGTYVGKEVTIKGWVEKSRSHGKVHFLHITDRSTKDAIQTVARFDQLTGELFKIISNLGVQSSVSFDGLVKEDNRAPGGYEIQINNLRVIQDVRDYPLANLEKKKYEGDPEKEFLRDNRHLDIRNPRPYTILKIRQDVIDASRVYLRDILDFKEINPPMLVSTICEAVRETENGKPKKKVDIKKTMEDAKRLVEEQFPDKDIDYLRKYVSDMKGNVSDLIFVEKPYFTKYYFGKIAALTVSGQLEMEAAMYANGSVFGVDPSFRAEKSRTPRHLTEFWQVEPEVAFADHEDNLKLQEDLVTYVVKTVAEKRKKELEFLGRDIKPLQKIEPHFERIIYTEAIDMLQKAGYDIKWGDDLGAPHEKFISLKNDKPTFIEKYPANIKPFYMQPDPKNPDVALCADLMAPEGYGEVIGGSQRIHDLKLLEQRIKEYKLNPVDYQWYIDLRKYGSVPHSGFGMGVERLTMWICHLDDIQETALFPRTSRRLSP
ncbi:MAG: asparagine--tRNA ligase [Candidatus Aenigmarchaeota archaeon]|nr:asparagine--tRNA ligase [Candidatus Aenigmarchaeota archaeon]